MKKLHDFYPFARQQGDLGLEVEVEFPHPFNLPIIPDWRIEADHSLRHFGVEFTTRGAIMDGPVKQVALKEIFDLIQQHKAILDSPRTSIHAHVNVQNLTPLEIWTAAFIYWSFESVLFKLCGADREGNLFCLRLRDASGLIAHIEEDLEKAYPFSTLWEKDDVRYSGQNINAVRKFGTLEFRGMAGLYDLDHIDMWTTGLVNMVRGGSKLFDTPDLFLDAMYDKSKRPGIMQKIFGPKMADRLLAIKNYHDLIDDDVFQILSVVYDNDWLKWQKRAEKAKQVDNDFDMPRPIIRDDIGLADVANMQPARARMPRRNPVPLPPIHPVAGNGVNFVIHDDLVENADENHDLFV